MNIVILAAGPPKPNRERHLEVFGGKPLIDLVIKKCRITDTKLYAVIDNIFPFKVNLLIRRLSMVFIIILHYL
jgi:hypothetical protein